MLDEWPGKLIKKKEITFIWVLPSDVPLVWSTFGPVLIDGVDPLRSSQSKSSYPVLLLLPFFTCDQVQKLCDSKSHDPKEIIKNKFHNHHSNELI